jgi:hypothetical protein
MVLACNCFEQCFVNAASDITGSMKRVADERLKLSNALHGVGQGVAGGGKGVPKLLSGSRLFGRAAASSVDVTAVKPAANGTVSAQQPAT